MTRILIDSAWREHVEAGWVELAETRLGPDIRDDAKRFAPVGPDVIVPDPEKHPRTQDRIGGELRESIEHHMEEMTLVIEAHAPYSAFVEEGTRPHEIAAQGPWSLWSPATGEYFGETVHHPGTRPEPYLRPALYQVRAEHG